MKHVTRMNRRELEREKDANSQEQSRLNDELIDLGYGHTPISQIPKSIRACARLYELADRHRNLIDELERIQLGYRTSAA